MMTHWWLPLNSNITPNQMRSRMLRDQLAQLISTGGTTGWHSQYGHTLSYYIVGLEEAGVPYVISAYPGLGYTLTVMPPETRGQGS